MYLLVPYCGICRFICQLCKLVSWCFELSQPLGILSGLYCVSCWLFCLSLTVVESETCGYLSYCENTHAVAIGGTFLTVLRDVTLVSLLSLLVW